MSFFHQVTHHLNLDESPRQYVHNSKRFFRSLNYAAEQLEEERSDKPRKSGFWFSQGLLSVLSIFCRRLWRRQCLFFWKVDRWFNNRHMRRWIHSCWLVILREDLLTLWKMRAQKIWDDYSMNLLSQPLCNSYHDFNQNHQANHDLFNLSRCNSIAEKLWKRLRKKVRNTSYMEGKKKCWSLCARFFDSSLFLALLFSRLANSRRHK